LVSPYVAIVLSQNFLYLTFIIYGSSCLIAAIASLLLPIETKGRELQDTIKDVGGGTNYKKLKTEQD
jgi:hypothetical protein